MQLLRRHARSLSRVLSPRPMWEAGLGSCGYDRSQAIGSATLTTTAAPHTTNESGPDRRLPISGARASSIIKKMSGGAAIPLTIAA